MGSCVFIWIRKYVVISTRMCYRSVCHHPFLVGLLCWLYLFYRLFPLLFSLVVYASPVLITTAVLLGTLLSYGEPNLPELEKKESKISDLPGEGMEAGAAPEVGVVDRNVGFDTGKLRKVRVLEDEDSDDEKESERDEVKEEDSDAEFGDDDNMPLIKRKSRNGKVGKRVSEEFVREDARSLEVDDEKEGSRTHGDESEDVGEGSSRDKEPAHVPDAEYERFESEDNHLVGEAVDGPYSLNTVYTSLSSSPKREEADDHEGSDSQNDSDRSSEVLSDEDDAEDEDSSESDADDSSSPNASMADIMPMLDELHPLLDVDATQPAHDDVNSTAHMSENASSIESGEDSENQEDDNGEDEDGDDDNEEDAQSNKGEGDKPGIIWTEDDQKNLMDMGTSEMERNQRLENLIARRWARKIMRLADEKNLIDLESNDLPFNVPHISTLRSNPFDAPLNSYDMTGLPPIPGSAPSILQPRKNPFDLPYDQNEEKPVLTGDNFAQEFIPPQRDAFFRRHESFSVGPSTLGNSRQEMRWKPYFVPERTAAEDAYASIQRQLSELSESKVSSVPETESVSSATDHEDRKLTEQDIMPETNMVSKDEHDSDHEEYESKSSEDAVWADVEHINRDVNQNEFEIQLGDQGSLQETCESPASIDESSNHVEFSHSEINMHENAVDEDGEGSSHSSSTIEMQVEHDEISMEIGHILDDFQEAGTNFSGSVETIRSEIYLPTEQVEDGSDSSSVTSLSETNEEVSDPIGRKESDGETGDLTEDSHFVIQSPVGTSVNLTVEIPDAHHIKEPVYDSSPQLTKKHFLFSPEYTDCQPESSVVRSSVVADESETQHVNIGFEEHKESEVIASSHLSIGNENQETNSASQTAGQDDIKPIYENEKTQHEQVQLPIVEVLTDVGQTSMSETTSTPHQHIMPVDATLPTAGEDQFHLEADQAFEVDRGSSSDTDSLEDNYVGKEGILRVTNESLLVNVSVVGPHASSDAESLENCMDARTLQVDRDESPIPSSDEDAPNHEQISVEPTNKHVKVKGESSLDMDQKQKVYETPTAESSSRNFQETMESYTVEAESTKKTSGEDTAPRTVPEVSVSIPLKNRIIESIKEMSVNGVPPVELDELQTPVSARYFDFTLENFQPNATDIVEVEDETEDYEEMDEGLLAELDTVGDFSVPSSEQVLLKSLVAPNPEQSRAGSLTLNRISETDTDLPVFEANPVDCIDMAFHQTEDVPVGEVILPSLLIGGRAAVDSKNVHVSEPDSPFSETKEVSPENEELVSLSTEALYETEVAPNNSGSSANTELQKEDMHTQKHDSIETPNHSPEETAAKDLEKKEKSHKSSSDSSSSDSDSD